MIFSFLLSMCNGNTHFQTYYGVRTLCKTSATDNYFITLLDEPLWALIKLFLDLYLGDYSRWALIRGWVLIKFSLFSASVVCLFCNKTINGNNKTRRCNKAGFCKIL